MPTPTNPSRRNLIDPNDLEHWLKNRIALDREAGDPDGYVAGLEFVLRVLRIRQRSPFHPVTPNPLPDLDGLYSSQDGLGDALSAVANTMLDHRPATFHIKVTRVVG